jgi:hypothetical protein
MNVSREICCKCRSAKRVPRQRYCAECRKIYMRQWRSKERAKVTKWKSAFYDVSAILERLKA